MLPQPSAVPSSKPLAKLGLGVRRVWQVLDLLGRLVVQLMFGLAAVVVVSFFIFAIFGDQIAPYAYDESGGFQTRWVEPCRTFWQAECEHPFGTDRLGQDVYSRVILGTREIFRVAGFGTAVAVVIGTTLGMTIAYYGGWLDEIVGRLLDSLMSIPVLILALVLLGTIEESRNSIIVVLIIVYSPIVARVVRSNVLEIKSRGFVEAAKLRGESPFYILGREILPLVMPTLVVEAALRFSYAIFLVASLGFLGLGAEPPIPNWGLMIFEAYNTTEYLLAPWTLNYPAATIALLVISLNITSDGIKRWVQRGTS